MEDTGNQPPAKVDWDSQEFKEWVFVMCGPAIMMDIVEDHLIKRGVPSHRILAERFDYD